MHAVQDFSWQTHAKGIAGFDCLQLDHGKNHARLRVCPLTGLHRQMRPTTPTPPREFDTITDLGHRPTARNAEQGSDLTLVLSNGWRLEIGDSVQPAALSRVLEALHRVG